jgi:esterase
MRTFEINGYRMAYVEEGRGEPLVMVHGSLSDYRYWARQAGPLSASLRVVSVRRYYSERWNGVGDDFTTRQHYEDVAAFIHVLGAGPVHLLGHSRGGNIAFRVGQHWNTAAPLLDWQWLAPEDKRSKISVEGQIPYSR